MSEITVRLGFLEANDLLSGLLLLRTAEEERAERIKAAGVYPQDTMEWLARLARTERKLRDAMRIPARTGLPDTSILTHIDFAKGTTRFERVLAASETPFPIPNDDLRDDPEAIQSGNGR